MRLESSPATEKIKLLKEKIESMDAAMVLLRQELEDKNAGKKASGKFKIGGPLCGLTDDQQTAREGLIVSNSLHSISDPKD